VNTTTLQPSAVGGPGLGVRLLLGLTMVAALLFVAVAALPYFTYNEARFGAYWPIRGWLLLHIVGGLVAVLTGPPQLWLGFADRRMGLHKSMGMAYVAAVVVGSAGAFPLAFQTQGGWVFGTGLIGLAIAWLTTTGMALLAVKRFLLEQHKEWMIRSYVVTFAFVTFRILFGALQALHIGTFPEAAGFASWAAWSVPLLITELFLQGRKITAVRA
jgi:hypothetical protein